MGNDDKKVITFNFCFTVQIYVAVESLEEEGYFLGAIVVFNKPSTVH